MRLFCLPHAGGSAKALAGGLGAQLTDVRTVPLELPGRGTRWQDPPYRDWSEATVDLAEQVVGQLTDEPYGLLGHSLGAVLAYELAQWLHEKGAAEPALLAIIARNPPHRQPEANPLHNEASSDKELFDAVVALGGVSPRAAGPLTYQTFLPVLRRDLRLAADYRPDPDSGPLDTELLVLHGTEDQLTSAASMPQWRQYTTGRTRIHAVPGDHFFVLKKQPDALSLIDAALRAADTDAQAA